MHAGIRSSGNDGADRPAGAKTLCCLLQDLLHGKPVFLTLPADKRRAIVFQKQRKCGHQCKRVPLGTGWPRRKSAAVRALPPASGARPSRKAPRPQATVSRSSNVTPGGPEPSAKETARIFKGLSISVVNVPGQGFNARTRRSISSALAVQSIRPSSRVSFFA